MKKKVGIIFGGCSSEYGISLISASSVIRNINNDKYDVILIGISKDGDFYLYNGSVDNIEKDIWLNSEYTKKITISSNRSDHGIIVLDTNEIIKLDVVFPVLHGKNGEDGRLQGLLELANIKYVGCDMLSSAICMDKYVAHKLVEAEGILVPKSYLFNKYDSYEFIVNEIKELEMPIYVKPLKAGSSYGISKVKDINELKEAIEEAFKFDTEIIIEEGIDGFEVGAAVYGNNDLNIGEVDEIELHTEFFDYEEKYNTTTSKTHLPARLSEEERKNIKNLALKIYKVLGCCGFARVDMFYNSKKEIVFNEVNTIPGFTSHSRFPNMVGYVGISFEEIVDKLIELGIEREF